MTRREPNAELRRRVAQEFDKYEPASWTHERIARFAEQEADRRVAEALEEAAASFERLAQESTDVSEDAHERGNFGQAAKCGIESQAFSIAAMEVRSFKPAPRENEEE